DEGEGPSGLTARVERDPAGRLLIGSPAVGIWCDAPRPGALLAGGARIGTLRRLEGRLDVVLPAGACGRVVRAPEDRAVGVEYAETVLILAPIESVPDGGGSPLAPEPGEGGSDLPP